MNYHYNLKTLFQEVAAIHQNSIAIRYGDKIHTYQELDRRSDELAAFLQSQNIGEGSVVVIISTKMFDDFALMIACLKLGACYTNIDPDNPRDRTRHIFETCRPHMVFTGSENQNIRLLCRQMGIQLMDYEAVEPVVASFEGRDIDGETIAYIMFTSGSTGIPKGVAITHQNLIHFIGWTTSRFGITEQDNFANISPMYFDNSVFDFYTALFSGATLIPVEKPLLTQPIEFVDYLDKNECTIWFSVPSMLIYMLTMRALKKNNLRTIRMFVFGGEGFPKPELKKLFELYKDRSEFINVYGPTECTCICSSYAVSQGDFENLKELLPLGPINPNFSYVIENEGVKDKTGELCLLGPNVGKGYYNDPERTENAFAFYTDEHHYQKPMYKTGDWVQEAGGLLHFKGRMDNQIKHMGYRIEIEEIEMVLNSLPEIRRSAVVYKRVSTAYGKIIAFVEAESNQELDIAQLKKDLAEKLPSYMIPNGFEIRDSLPKNANGKIDRVRLHSEYPMDK